MLVALNKYSASACIYVVSMAHSSMLLRHLIWTNHTMVTFDENSIKTSFLQSCLASYLCSQDLYECMSFLQLNTYHTIAWMHAAHNNDDNIYMQL